jgi:hypothetical protein
MAAVQAPQVSTASQAPCIILTGDNDVDIRESWDLHPRILRSREFWDVVSMDLDISGVQGFGI